MTVPRLLFIVAAGLFYLPLHIYGQTVKDSVKKIGKPVKKNTFFANDIVISQSTVTAEQQQLPAQFNITIPKTGKTSFLVDAGIGITLDTLFHSYNKVSFIAEYHRNTLIDSVQNNMQFGFKGNFSLNSPSAPTSYFLVIDPKYIYDGVKKQNSIGSDFLFTWDRDADGFHWNTANLMGDNAEFVPAILAGSQVQQVFKSDTTMSHGLIVRPLATGSANFFFYAKGKRFKPAVQLAINFTQRYAAVNRTGDGERFTHVFKTEADYFIIYDPVKLSIGVSWVEGSDPMSGLKAQQYFLFSLNLSKSGKK